MVWIATHAFAALALAVLCYGTGRAAIARLPCASNGLRAVVATGLGLGLFGQILFAIGSVGALTRPVVIALLAVMAMVAVPYLRELWPLASRTPWAVLLVLAAGSVLTFLRALYPPLGWDATMYHLAYARLFADAGSLIYAGFLRFPVFPQLNEMWFTAAMLVADDVTAQLTQWLCFLVTGAAIIGISRAWGDLRSALVGAAIWFSIPLASYLGSQAYIDCGLTMAVTLAFVAWIQWRSTDHPGWALLVGAFAGMAAATKYHGLFFIVFFGLAIIFFPSRRRFANASLFLLGVIITAAPWYLRIAARTGNPLFPYFGSIFGANDWGLSLAASGHRGDVVDSLYNLRLWIAALAIPAAAGAVADRRVRFLFFGAMSYAVLVWTLDSRFMIVSLPLLAICSTAAVRWLIERLPRQARATTAAILVVAALFPAIATGLRDLRRLGSIPRTAAERDAFLEKRIWPYGALRFLAKTNGTRPTVYVLHGENALYYWQGRYLGDWFGPYRYAFVLPFFREPDRLARVLRGYGADYMIVRRRDGFDPAGSNAFELVYESETEMVFRIRSRQ